MNELAPQNPIITYTSKELHLEVRVENETVWLTQKEIALLFGTQRPAITKQLANIFNSKELSESSVCSILELTAEDNKVYQTKYYNLDAILSVGYRVNSIKATQFRIWANSVLKDYLLKGYAVSRRFERIEDKLFEHDKQIAELVQTARPPRQGIFFDGQIFDAYIFINDLIKSAKSSIILIDNYIDESVLLLLSKRNSNISAKICTNYKSNTLKLDLEKYNQQYPKIEIIEFRNAHDRFLIIDKSKLYMIGASLKDLGKKWFGFSLIEDEIFLRDILKRLK